HRARLHLLAAASLPYATEVAPDTRQEVTTRAAALMPPRSTQEAAVLSALGPGILDLLPPTAEGLAQDEIQAVLRVAATMGGDQAYAYLQQFSSTLDHEVPLQELTLGWSNFEATDYARGILRPLRDRLHVTVRTPAQFEALPLLTPIKHISFSLALTPPEIMRHLSPEYTTSVSLRDMEGPRLQALSFVRSLTALRSLSLGPSTPVDGLDHLVGLPLQHLNLHDLPDGFSFQALSELSQLRELLLYTVLPWRTLHVLPAPPTLTRLWLGRWVEASVTGIAQWPTLEEVVVNHVMDAVEWDELGELGQLTDLHVTDPDFAGARVMETVNRLGVSLTRSDIRLDLIPDRFPNLERFSIHRSADVACDLTPLQPFTNLQIAVYNADRVALTGLEGFRAGQITLSPRPRLVSRSAPAQRAS
ncbi:NACHT domain-containing protein, partial [Streptomyces sp. NPDC003487]